MPWDLRTSSSIDDLDHLGHLRQVFILILPYCPGRLELFFFIMLDLARAPSSSEFQTIDRHPPVRASPTALASEPKRDVSIREIEPDYFGDCRAWFEEIHPPARDTRRQASRCRRGCASSPFFCAPSPHLAACPAHRRGQSPRLEHGRGR